MTILRIREVEENHFVVSIWGNKMDNGGIKRNKKLV